MNCQLEDNEESLLIRSSSQETWPADSIDSVELKNRMRNCARVKGSKCRQKKINVYSLLSVIAELKKENRMLRQMLADKSKTPERSRFRLRRVEGRSTPLRRSFCETCTRLLSKGYTTRFCPVHGFNKVVFDN